MAEQGPYKAEVPGSSPGAPNPGRLAQWQSIRLTCEGSEVQVLYRPMEIIYEDENLLVINKPAGINADDFEKRIHRLDKDTSGILLIAKNEKALDFFQKQFQNGTVVKKYLALVSGSPSSVGGEIETLIGRSKKDGRKQQVYLLNEPDAQRKGLRKAVTKYKIIKKFEDYTLLEVQPKTGRKHQIRCHLAYLGHPIAGDKIYGFKNQLVLKGLTRQFLHASYLKIKLPNGRIKEFKSELPEDLKINPDLSGEKLK